MAHGFVSYSKPKSDLNLPSLIAGKVKDSFGMAAEERKAREKEIAELKERVAGLEILETVKAELNEDFSNSDKNEANRVDKESFKKSMLEKHADKLTEETTKSYE